MFPCLDRVSLKGDGVEAVHGQYHEEVGREVKDVVVLYDDHEGYKESCRLDTEPGTAHQDEKDVVHTLDHRSYAASTPMTKTMTTTTTTVGRNASN